MSELSHGDKIRDRVWLLVAAVVQYANGELDPGDTLRLGTKLRWRNDDRTTQQIVGSQISKHDLAKLTKILNPNGGLSDRQILESLTKLRDFLAPTGIFTDNRVTTKGGKGDWYFTFKLWFSELTPEREQEFQAKWAACHPQPSTVLESDTEANSSETAAAASSSPSASQTEKAIPGNQTYVNTHVTHNHGTVIPFVNGNITINQSSNLADR